MGNRPVHGGRLSAAARRWQIPREQWLDLSTGINPHGWPVPELPAEVWRRLPEDEDGLAEAIRSWAGIPAEAACLPVAGSQAAIQALPHLFPTLSGRAPGRIGVPAPGYREHGHCWAQAGFEVRPLGPDGLEAELETVDAVVWIQPNNPTGVSLSRERLLDWHSRLAVRGGWLVVDEAFIGDPGIASLASHTGREGLVVLRSLGKFFGLAGIRAGAVLAWPLLCERLDQVLGPWAVGGPARYLMARALADTAWQAMMARRLQDDSKRLRALLGAYGLTPAGGSLLFQYVPHPRALGLAEQLAQEAILVRYFSQPAALRFGLPGTASDWQRLERALAKLSQP